MAWNSTMRSGACPGVTLTSTSAEAGGWGSGSGIWKNGWTWHGSIISWVHMGWWCCCTWKSMDKILAFFDLSDLQITQSIFLWPSCIEHGLFVLLGLLKKAEETPWMEYRRAAFNRRYLTVMESPHFHVRKGLQQITPNHRMSNFVELHSGFQNLWDFFRLSLVLFPITWDVHDRISSNHYFSQMHNAQKPVRSILFSYI